MNQLGGSKTDTLVKLVLVFFISLLSFSVGTFVGKKFSDSQHKLAQLESQYDGDRHTASVPSDHLDVKPKDALTDEDIAKLAEEFVIDDTTEHSEQAAHDEHDIEKHADNSHKTASHGDNHHADKKHVKNDHGKKHKKKEKVAHKKSKSKKHKKGHSAKESYAAKKVAHGKNPITKPKRIDPSKRIPSSLPSAVASSTVGRYTVQVSSFPTEAEAQNHAKKLKQKGFSAFYIPAKVKGKTWFRVNVGLFSKKKEAKIYRKKFMKQAGLSSAIVQKIVK